VLANAYRIVDEKLEKCVPCEPKVVKRGKITRTDTPRKKRR